MSESNVLEFNCPECGTSIEVNGSMRVALLDSGCVVCGAPVTRTAFSGS